MSLIAAGRSGGRLAALAAALIIAGTLSAEAARRPAPKTPNAFQGFSADSGKPVNVKSDSIEVHQQQQKAIFIGRVVATQGDSTLRAPRVIVYYDNAGTGAATDPGGAIKRLEAVGGVTVLSKDQRATGSRGVFDMVTNRATLIGNVVLVQGTNVIRGQRLVVDLKTGLARVVGGTEARFTPDEQAPQMPARRAKRRGS